MGNAADDHQANILLGLALLLGSVALFFMLPWKPALVHRPAATGDPNTIFGAIFFAYWSAVLGAAALFPKKCFLFAFLTRRSGAGVIAAVFAVMAAYLLVVWFGWLN
jgi:hypothetical protein